MGAKTLYARTGFRSPFADSLKIQDEMNRLFESALGRRGRGAKPTEVEWTPPLDVYEGDDALVVLAELPGMRQEEIEITINENLLVIRGERKPDATVKEESYHRRERYTGPFHRTLGLPSMVDTTRVKATYRNGVLEIRLPKREEARPRTIKVDAA